jgi:hypothetical protein
LYLQENNVKCIRGVNVYATRTCNLKGSVFWDIKPCSPLNVNYRCHNLYNQEATTVHRTTIDFFKVTRSKVNRICETMYNEFATVPFVQWHSSRQRTYCTGPGLYNKYCWHGNRQRTYCTGPGLYNKYCWHGNWQGKSKPIEEKPTPAPFRPPQNRQKRLWN